MVGAGHDDDRETRQLLESRKLISRENALLSRYGWAAVASAADRGTWTVRTWVTGLGLSFHWRVCARVHPLTKACDPDVRQHAKGSQCWVSSASRLIVLCPTVLPREVCCGKRRDSSGGARCYQHEWRAGPPSNDTIKTTSPSSPRFPILFCNDTRGNILSFV